MASIDKRANGWKARWRTPLGESRSKTFKRKADAEDTSDEKSKSGKWWAAISTHRLSAFTLADWWQRYCIDVTSRRATTVARDEAVMRRWWLSSLGNRRLAMITPAQVRSIVTAMTDKLQPSTVRTNLGVFRAVMSLAVEAELITRSPVRGIHLPAEHRDEPRFLSAEELHRLANAIPDEYRPMIFLAAVLTLRWSEVVGLRVGRIDFLRRTVSVVETMAEVEGKHMAAPPKSKASTAHPVYACWASCSTCWRDTWRGPGVLGAISSCSPPLTGGRCELRISAVEYGHRPSKRLASTG